MRFEPLGKVLWKTVRLKENVKAHRGREGCETFFIILVTDES